ncbi:MAG: CRISPR-associated endonuclease Cas2 [Oscillospiraceae bacterium]|nr:CRISPR-associated endonuclease Cas2 [Oscillospiraceae bacterium]
MSYRYMRIILFFDLPSVTYYDIRAYTKFRKFLINEGFIIMQESVYTKLALNNTSSKLIQERVRKNKPPKGIIQMLVVTEKQFAGMEYVIGGGSGRKDTIDNTNRLVIL